MKEYNVYFKETLEKCEKIKANSEEEAYNIAKEMYDKEQVVLDYSNFVDMDIEVKEQIRALLIKPHKLPQEIVINNDLETYQRLVDGYIEVTKIMDDYSVDIVCNEEGKINNFPLNRCIGNDIIAGTFVIVGSGDLTGDFTSLTDDQIKTYKEKFGLESIKETEQQISKIFIEKPYIRTHEIER